MMNHEADIALSVNLNTFELLFTDLRPSLTTLRTICGAGYFLGKLAHRFSLKQHNDIEVY